MVTTELCDTDVIGHIHRDIAGLFTPTATALQRPVILRTTDVDTEILECAERVVSRTLLAWDART